MTTQKLLLACVGYVALTAGQVQAGLIGDLVSVEYHFPDQGTVVEAFPTVVVAGAGDTVTFFQTVPQVNVNVEAESVLIDWLIAPKFQAGNFNGIVINDMDWVANGPGIITGLDITTDAQGWNDSFASFTDDSISINYAPLGDVPEFSMTVDLLVQHAAVPEPTSLAIFGLGALGMGIRRRKKKQSA